MEKKADDSVFIFSASDSEDTPIYSSKKLQSMLETSKEMLIRDQRSNQSTSKKKTSDSFENIFVKKDINEEVASIVYSSVLAEKGKEIAELLLGEHDSEKKDLLKKDLEEKILQLKKIKARENASLSEEEKNTADERIKTFNMIADRVDLSNEERLIKLSEIAEAMDESMRLAMDKIDKAKEQIQFDSVFKRKTAVNSTLANFIAFLAISIGYSNEDFLVDLALSGLIKKNKANLKISALPDLVKFLINGDGEGSLQLSLQDDATQILELANAYMSHSKFNPNNLGMDLEIFSDISKKLPEQDSVNIENLEIWRQSIEKRPEMNTLGYCGIVSTKAHTKLRSYTIN